MAPGVGGQETALAFGTDPRLWRVRWGGEGGGGLHGGSADKGGGHCGATGCMAGAYAGCSAVHCMPGPLEPPLAAVAVWTARHVYMQWRGRVTTHGLLLVACCFLTLPPWPWQSINSWAAIADACSKTKTLQRLCFKDCLLRDGERTGAGAGAA